MTAANPAVEAPTSTPLPEDRAHSLFRWNAVLAALHGIQGLDRSWRSPSPRTPSSAARS